MQECLNEEGVWWCYLKIGLSNEGKKAWNVRGGIASTFLESSDIKGVSVIMDTMKKEVRGEGGERSWKIK